MWWWQLNRMMVIMTMAIATIMIPIMMMMMTIPCSLEKLRQKRNWSWKSCWLKSLDSSSLPGIIMMRVIMKSSWYHHDIIKKSSWKHHEIIMKWSWNHHEKNDKTAILTFPWSRRIVLWEEQRERVNILDGHSVCNNFNENFSTNFLYFECFVRT